MDVKMNESWKARLQDQFDQDYFVKLTEFVRNEYRTKLIFPPAKLIFNAFDHTRFEDVKVVILGQDPYHGDGQAQGLSFSVPDGVKIPPSLVNIYKEINAEFAIATPRSGNLTRWADQGILLLNSILTVEAHKAGSHQKKGWEIFTDAAIRKLADEREHIVFFLWGAYAQKKAAFIDSNKHLLLKSVHPSPLSAYGGFFGNDHFKLANEYLVANGKQAIDW